MKWTVLAVGLTMAGVTPPMSARAQPINPLIGTWQGFLSHGGQSYNTAYSFSADGTIQEFTTDLNGRVTAAFNGRYTCTPAADTIIIRWPNGKLERGAVAPLGPDTFRYMITGHSDPTWIGVTVVFRRTQRQAQYR
ncbi:MAG TPA: hypothetical protein VF590_14315 [Isosphaeraceae bacterium]